MKWPEADETFFLESLKYKKQDDSCASQTWGKDIETRLSDE